MRNQIMPAAPRDAGAAGTGAPASRGGACAVLERPETGANPRPQGREENDRPRRVCFVCTGNTCRSPMAAAVANALAAAPAGLPEEARGAPVLEAFSAGLAAAEGEPIAPNAVLALEAAGVPAVPGRDYHRHTAHTLCVEEAERYDLLLAVSRRHALELLLRCPHLAGRLEQLARLVRARLFPEAGA